MFEWTWWVVGPTSETDTARTQCAYTKQYVSIFCFYRIGFVVGLLFIRWLPVAKGVGDTRLNVFVRIVGCY
jgi:hypothetical protein